ncbi:MAG: hemolysin family protein [Longimicrobiales bacterium]|jgi:putative hemolysin
MTGMVLGLIGLLLLLSAVLTAAETAAFQISSSRLRTLQEEGFTGAEALIEVRRQAGLVGSSVRLATGMLKLSALGAGVVTGAWTLGNGSPWANVVVGVALVIIVCDLVPYVIAARNPVRMALSSASGLLTLTRLTRFVAVPVSRLEEAWVGNGDGDLSTEERELREIQEIGQEAGILEESENILVERAFRLDDLTAWDVMVPRVDIFAWKEGLALSEIHDQLADVPYSRVPVYRDSVDDVTGIVYVREVYERLADGQRDVKLSELSHDPFFVPGSLSCAQLLRDFQARRIHMGLVADEFGGTDGLVTLEDVVEELVGEIHDETDVAEEELIRISGIEIECDAGADVRDINEALDVALPKVEHRSLNGLILEELGHVPPEGESFERHGVRIDIIQASETQVLRARVTRLPAASATDTD